MKKLLCLLIVLMLPMMVLADGLSTATDLATETDVKVQDDAPLYRAKMA